MRGKYQQEIMLSTLNIYGDFKKKKKKKKKKKRSDRNDIGKPGSAE